MVVNKKIRILICADHPLFVEGIKALLRNETSLEIIGEARDGRQLVVRLAIVIEIEAVLDATDRELVDHLRKRSAIRCDLRAHALGLGNEQLLTGVSAAATSDQ